MTRAQALDLIEYGKAALMEAESLPLSAHASSCVSKAYESLSMVGDYVEGEEPGAPALTFVLPLPPKGLAQNDHSHWRSRQRASKEHREAARIIALASTRERRESLPLSKASVRPIYYCAPRVRDGRYRPLDAGNAIGAIKAAVDGLTDAGIFKSDDHRTVTILPAVLKRTKKEHQGRAELVLEVRAVTQEEDGR